MKLLYSVIFIPIVAFGMCVSYAISEPNCRRYRENMKDPIVFPNPEDCRSYFRCTSKTTFMRRRCRDDEEFFSQRTGDCKKIDTFSPTFQNRCFIKMNANGTTKDLKAVFIGRCLEYQRFLHPEFFVNGEINCDMLFRKFFKAFAGKRACGEVKFGAYRDFIDATELDLLPTDKLLFWSNIKEFSEEYAGNGKRLFTLEGTLLGYLIDDLTWCGKPGTQSGVNEKVCPPWPICEGNPMVVFWEEASQYFAQMATDTITLMLNGSDPETAAFREKSFFAEHELPNLSVHKINKVKVWVAHELDIPVRETCRKGSPLILKRLLANRGFNYNCQDNPAEVLHLLCTNKPFHPDCIRIKPRKDTWSHGRIFEYKLNPVPNRK